MRGQAMSAECDAQASHLDFATEGRQQDRTDWANQTSVFLGRIATVGCPMNDVKLRETQRQRNSREDLRA